MHVDLSPHLHIPECNKLISELKSCFEENRYMKFLSACDQLEIKVEKCLRRERIQRQALHNKNAEKEKLERIERIKAMS